MKLLPDPLPTHPKPRDRDEIIEWTRERLRLKDFVILDTETTGFDPGDEVVQIGIIDADGSELLDTLVKPEEPRLMPKRAEEVHGITMEMLANAPTLFELAQQIMNEIDDRLVICYNDQFDMRLIEQTSSKYDLSSRGCNLQMKSDCAMLAYSQFIGTPGKYSGQYKWQKLPRLNEENHKAVSDCHLTLALMRDIAAISKHSELPSLTIDYAQPDVQTIIREAIPMRRMI